MQIVYAGPASQAFLAAAWPEPPTELAHQPLFEIDLLLLFAGEEIPPEQRETCKLVERSGRPTIRFGAVDLRLCRSRETSVIMIRDFIATDVDQYLYWAASRSHTNYKTVDCNFYDRIEEAITLRQSVHLEYLSASGNKISEDIHVIDTKTDRGEEFIQLEDSCWLRLDRIVSLDGVAAGGSCQY